MNLPWSITWSVKLNGSVVFVRYMVGSDYIFFGLLRFWWINGLTLQKSESTLKVVTNSLENIF